MECYCSKTYKKFVVLISKSITQKVIQFSPNIFYHIGFYIWIVETLNIISFSLADYFPDDLIRNNYERNLHIFCWKIW